ncbi:MAG: hypothetical protein AAF108_03765, partial [Planctomycetota bacterium]
MPPGDAQPGLRQRFMYLMDRVGIVRDWAPIGIGAAIGSLTGLGAVGFERALHWFEHAVERGHHAMGDRGFGLFGLVLFPAIGMGLTGLLVHLFAAEAKGHGVPQVIRAILTRGGVISPR